MTPKDLLNTDVTEMPLVRIHGIFHREGGQYPFPFGEAHVSHWYNARVAIWQGIHALGLRAGDRVLVPAYACGAEIDVLLSAGLTVDYYRANADLSADLGDIARLCQQPTQAVYIIHYFGVPQPMDALLAFVHKRRILLIEDNAHGLYSTDPAGSPLGSFGDMSVFSLHKTLAIPDGGLLLLRSASAHARVRDAGVPPDFLAVAGLAKFLLEERLKNYLPSTAKWVKGALTDPLIRYIKSHRGARVAIAENASPLAFQSGTCLWMMSQLTRRLLGGAVHGQVGKIRRRNFNTLQALLKSSAELKPMIEKLPAGACPWIFPVRTDEPEALANHLHKRRIGHFRVWSFFHPEFPQTRFPYESALKRSVVALPVHQDLGLDKIARVADALNAWSGTDPRAIRDADLRGIVAD